MTAWPRLAALFAQQIDPADMGRQFRGDYAALGVRDVLIWLGIAVGVAVLIWLLRRAQDRQSSRRTTANPRGLFRALCHAHGLSRANRRLLRRMAKIDKLEHPGRLFVEPARFTADEIPSALQSKRTQIMALGDRLFSS